MALHDAKGRKTGLFIVDLWHGVLSHRQYVSSERHDPEYGGDESPVVNISFTVIDGSSYDMRGYADEPTKQLQDDNIYSASRILVRLLRLNIASLRIYDLRFSFGL
jgi:hypothetical protein